ncbi:FkbM family methyltransferase [Granulicella sp. dw_53]|uniref:FkbM family methyltransferase n=1 Tax=Granulicella sp. dw_53 TaxID=2719792 RepID=UPI001BD3204F|nr:FkbM family methyltransferase [Granulicella sp. dw_53]
MVTKGQIAKCVWQGPFEERERELVTREIQPGMRVLNIGANTGLYTIIASRLVGLDGIVHAFEPSSRNFALLEENVKLNGCRNVVANNIALADFQGQLSLNGDSLHPEFDGHFYVRPLTETPTPAAIEVVSCTTLDKYWSDACGGEITPVDFIIIDVEGAELSVFLGAQQTVVASTNLTMIMECSSDLPEITLFLKEFGFLCFRFDSDGSQLIPSEVKQGTVIALRKKAPDAIQ